MRRAMCLEATEREALATDARSTSRSASLIGRKVVCCGGGGPSQLFMGGPDLVSLSSTARGVRDDAVKMWIPVQVQQFFGGEQGWESTEHPCHGRTSGRHLRLKPGQRTRREDISRH